MSRSTTSAANQRARAITAAKSPPSPTTIRPIRPIRPRVAPHTATTTAPTLYTHQPHPHTPQNANDVHLHARLARVKQYTGWRERIAQVNLTLAVWLTKHTGSMACAWLFASIGVGSLVGVFTNNALLAAVFGSVSSYFLQLTLLPILSVGQGVLSQHAEAQADEQFHATLRAVHENEQIAHHLDAQDSELLKQSAAQRQQMAELRKQTALLLNLLDLQRRATGAIPQPSSS